MTHGERERIEERNRLAVKNLGLGTGAARRFQRVTQEDIDDVEGECLVCLVEACRSFDPKKGKLSTLVYNYTFRRLCNSERARASRAKRERKSTIGKATFAPAAVDEAANHEIALHQVQAVQWLLSLLSPRERQIIEMRFGMNGEEPLTFQEIGNRLGRSRQAIQKTEAQAMTRLRAAVGA